MKAKKLELLRAAVEALSMRVAVLEDRESDRLHRESKLDAQYPSNALAECEDRCGEWRKEALELRQKVERATEAYQGADRCMHKWIEKHNDLEEHTKRLERYILKKLGTCEHEHSETRPRCVPGITADPCLPCLVFARVQKRCGGDS